MPVNVVASPVLYVAPDDVEEPPRPLSGAVPLAVMDWLSELLCVFWAVSGGTEASDDVALCDSTFVPGMKLIVENCDVEKLRSVTHSLELDMAVVPPCKLLGFEAVGPDPLDVVPSAKLVLSMFPPVASWLDKVPIDVDDPPCAAPPLEL